MLFNPTLSPFDEIAKQSVYDEIPFDEIAPHTASTNKKRFKLSPT
jgi:hypothetical protein